MFVNFLKFDIFVIRYLPRDSTRFCVHVRTVLINPGLLMQLFSRDVVGKVDFMICQIGRWSFFFKCIKSGWDHTV